MVLRVFPFETTNFNRNEYPWEQSFSNANYRAVLIGSGYVYDQSKYNYSDISNYVLGNNEAVNPENRRITIESGGNDTIYRSGRIGFTTNNQAYDAIGIMIFIIKGVNLANDDPLFLWFSFGEITNFKTTDSIDGNNGIYYLNSELF